MKKINKVGVSCCYPQCWWFMPQNWRKRESRQQMSTDEDAYNWVWFTDCGSCNAAIASHDAGKMIGWLAHNFTLGLKIPRLQLFHLFSKFWARKLQVVCYVLCINKSPILEGSCRNSVMIAQNDICIEVLV